MTTKQEQKLSELEAKRVENFEVLRQEFYPSIPQEIFYFLQDFLWVITNPPNKVGKLSGIARHKINSTINDWFQEIENQKPEIIVAFLKWQKSKNDCRSKGQELDDWDEFIFDPNEFSTSD